MGGVRYGHEFRGEFPEERSVFDGTVVSCTHSELQLDFGDDLGVFCFARDVLGRYIDPDGWAAAVQKAPQEEGKAPA